MRYFIGFLVSIGLIILLIVMLAGGGDKKAEVPTTNKSLYSYANTDAEVRMTVDGPINYDGDHKQVTITVSQDTVIYNQINGYTGQVVKGQSFPNNEAAFSNFLHALYHAGFTKINTDDKLRDERGFCPQGNRYIFELTQDGRTLQRSWATNCGNPKTFLGAQSITTDLFRAQVPNYDQLSAGDNDQNNYNFF